MHLPLKPFMHTQFIHVPDGLKDCPSLYVCPSHSQVATSPSDSREKKNKKISKLQIFLMFISS